MNGKRIAIASILSAATLFPVFVAPGIVSANSDCRNQSGTVSIPAGAVLRSMKEREYGNVTLVNAEALPYSAFCSGDGVTSYFVTRNGLKYQYIVFR